MESISIVWLHIKGLSSRAGQELVSRFQKASYLSSRQSQNSEGFVKKRERKLQPQIANSPVFRTFTWDVGDKCDFKYLITTVT